MSEYQTPGKIVVSAMKADVHPQTAGKYIDAGKPPAQLQTPHHWRTRPDPLAKTWAAAVAMLREAPELEAKTLFEYFLARPDSGLAAGHLRTFQRRVRQWHATQGPEQAVIFAQDRQPGELRQLDWTYAKELAVTIQGEALDHLFCQCVLPYSNWQWATRCLSESFLSLVSGFQAAVVRLGKSPLNLGTDNTSAATHDLEDLPGRPRADNSDYLELCTHYDLSPIPIHVNCPNEQGDVESLNRHLRLRGDRGGGGDFRHVVVPLLRKPGAFIHYRHREALYPSATFRAAFDRLVSDHGERPGVIEYLQVLKLAAEVTVERVEALLQAQLARAGKWRATEVRDLVAPPARKVIELAALTPSLTAYDALLGEEVAHVG
jgi:hypothetical protein